MLLCLVFEMSLSCLSQAEFNLQYFSPGSLIAPMAVLLPFSL